MNLEAYVEKEKALSPRSAELCALAKMDVVTVEDAATATDAVKAIRGYLQKVEDERTSLVRPLNEHVKELNKRFSRLVEAPEEALKTLRAKLGEFHQLQAAIAAEKRAAEQKTERERLEAQASYEVAPPAPTIATPPAIVRSDSGSSSGLRKVKKWRIIDKAALFAANPDFLITNDRAIQEALKAGDVPGVEQYEETIVAVR